MIFISVCYLPQTVDPASQVDKVVIPNRQKCGRAVHGDRVVVEILHENRSAMSVAESAEYEPKGQVMGVLQRAIEPVGRMFVCQVQPPNTGE